MKLALAALVAGLILIKNVYVLLNARKTAQEVEEWRKSQGDSDARQIEE